MKTAFITMMSLLFLTSCAQDKIRGNGNHITETRTVSANFDKVESAGAFDVIIKDAPQDGKIKLEGDSNILEKIEVEVQGNTLVLKTKKGFSINFNGNVEITFSAQNLKSVGLSGSGSILTEGVQKTDDFNVGLSGSGDIDVKVSAQHVTAGLSGSGNINLDGNAESLKTAISGSGDIDAYQLKADKVDVGISGSGNTKVYTDGEINAAIGGSGDVYYKGNPTKVNAKSGGSGDVRKAD